jgi:phage repressor protein C with HTH and peptisase S24 domain
MTMQVSLSVNESPTLRIVRLMKSVGHRIKQLRQALDLTQEEFALRLDLTRGAIGNWELSKGIKTENLRLIADVFECSMDWLATGRGAMFSGKAAAEAPDRDDDITRVPDELPAPPALMLPPGGIVEIDVRAGLGGGGEVAVEYFRAETGVVVGDAVKPEPWLLPPSFVREQFQAPASKLIVVETRGDSMVPTILPGERVFIDTGHLMPSPDGIYAIRDRFGYVVIKRLQVSQGKRDPQIQIISDNKSHPVEVVGLDEIEIIGKVIAGIRLF